MSYENVPKNLTEQAVLVRAGRPDYSKLEAAAFPTPTLDERGAVLENTDTGNRYVWTGTIWIQTHNIGFPLPIETSNTGNVAVPVFIQDQTTQAIDIFFTENKGMVTTATVATQGGHSVDLEPGHGAIAGDVIEARTAENYVQAEILLVVGDTITVSTPWSRTFPIGTVVGLGNPLLSTAVGTPAAPVVFNINPSMLQRIDITGIILNFIDNTAMDFTTFGSLAQLVTGCTLRKLNTDLTFTNHFNWRDNGELIERSFDHNFQSKIGGGSFGFVARSTWAGQDKRGVTIRLNGALLEELQIVVQDDLTGLDKLRVVAQGHIVQ